MRARTMIRAVLVALALPAAAGAQLANPVPQAVGMGGNYTAVARGFGAVAWNPAGLGMPDNPRMSLALLPLVATAGLDPIGPADLAEFDGQLIPYDTRVRWLELIQEAGGESGAFAGDVTYLGLSIGRFALQASTNVRGRINVAPDVAEIFFFGNAGLTGDPGSYTLEGSTFDIAGTSTVAASLALPLSLRLGPLPDQHFAVGATLKYTVGNVLAVGQENGSTLSDDPLGVSVAFPIVHTGQFGDSTDFDFGDSFDNGSGIGLDVGAAWQGGMFAAGVTIQNLVNTFEWDLDRLRYREGVAFWDADTSYTSFDERDIADAPGAVLERIDDLYEFSPVVAAGAAARLTPFLRVTGDVRHALRDNLDVGARNHLGAGAELTIVPFLPVRAGLALISGGYQLSAGLGLRLGPVQLAASGALREAEFGSDAVAAAGLVFGLP